jgi:predicted phage terminase large subunit-like protein
LRANPGAVEAFIVATAELDAAEFGRGEVLQVLEQDPGSAGVYEIRALVKALRGHAVKAQRPTGDKVTRAKPVAGQARVGNIYLVRAPWNGVFIAEAERFPMGKKDQIDCLSGASTLLMEVGKPKIQNQRRKLRSMRKAAMGGY